MVRRDSRGFTLIELLVVIAVIAVLMGIIMPALRAAKDQARLAICSSNMRQLAIAVNTYTADNDNKTPPPVASRPASTLKFSWPNFLNQSGKAMYPYLGQYIADVGTYMCPLAPANPVDYQEAYVNYQDNPNVMVSYNMYWGGYEMADIEFVGPRSGSSRMKLLASDTLNYGPTNDGKSRWYSSHRSEESYKTDINDGWGNLVSTLWFIDGKVDSCPQGIKLNMVFMDGHAERYTSDETVTHNHGSARCFQVPPKNKWK
ncbi:type II secretion system protein [Planctomycetota bacterium]